MSETTTTVTPVEVKKSFWSSTMHKLQEYVMKNTREALMYALLILVAIIIVLVLLFKGSAPDQKALVQFESAYFNFIRPVASPDERTKIIGECIADFINLAKEYEGTDIGNKSRFYLGNAYYILGLSDKGQLPNAIAELQKFLKKASKHYLAPAAVQLLGNAYEESGDLNNAIETYKKIEKDYADSGYIPTAMMDIARCYETANNPGNAKELYQSLITKYSNSAFSTFAKRRLLLLRATGAM